MKTIQVRRIICAGHCWRSRDELISDILLWPLHMDEQRQDDQLERTYNSSVPTQDVALKTYRERWTIEKCCGRGSGRSVLAAQHDLDKVYVLCFDLLTRPIMPFKVMHRKEVTHSNGSYERKSRGRKLADEMGRAKKIHMVHYRVMHRKRVTSELHDSYFRLMTIKHSISKIGWASNDYIIQLSSTSRELEIGRRRRDVVRKVTSGWRGLWALVSGP